MMRFGSGADEETPAGMYALILRTLFAVTIVVGPFARLVRRVSAP